MYAIRSYYDSELPQNKETPWHLWIIGVLATLWNSIGVMDFTMTVTRNEAYMSSFTEAQLAYYYSFPIGIYLLWGLAVLSARITSYNVCYTKLLRRRMIIIQYLCNDIIGLTLNGDT